MLLIDPRFQKIFRVLFFHLQSVLFIFKNVSAKFTTKIAAERRTLSGKVKMSPNELTIESGDCTSRKCTHISPVKSSGQTKAVPYDKQIIKF